tara:strand:- start:304 stop:408 length:105 start_codon:yes stop_codon:yes gene_type:complete
LHGKLWQSTNLVEPAEGMEMIDGMGRRELKEILF